MYLPGKTSGFWILSTSRGVLSPEQARKGRYWRRTSRVCTAKGGVIFALAKHTGIPIRFIGIGEGIDDLQDFDAELFVDALFVKD